MKKFYVLCVPYSLEIRRLFQMCPGVYLIPANYLSPEFMKQWVLYITFYRLAHYSKEAAWPSGLGRWSCNLEVPGSSPTPCH